jgi:Sulfotransferase family
MLSTRHNFLFIHVPKTGGNSIQKVLLPHSDDQLVLISRQHDGVDRFEIRSNELSIHKHSSLQEYCDQLDAEKFDRLIKVTSVRNPWDRCVSYFFSPHRGPVVWSESAFEDFIRTTVHPHSKYLTLEGRGGNPFDHVDVVLRFERLAKDFASLCGRIGVYAAELPRLNASRRGDYRSYFTTQRAIDLVANRFALEIAIFGYEF